MILWLYMIIHNIHNTRLGISPVGLTYPSPIVTYHICLLESWVDVDNLYKMKGQTASATPNPDGTFRHMEIIIHGKPSSV